MTYGTLSNRRPPRPSRRGAWPALIAIIGVSVAGGPQALAAAPPAPAHVATKAADAPARAEPAPAQTEVDPASRNVVARARMNECGHQWSSLKRAGTASGTWRDFSRVCNAQK